MSAAELRARVSESIPTPTGFRIACELSGVPDDMPAELWYVVDSPTAPVRPPRSADFAACALLQAAMSIGAPLVVDGPVHAGLIRNLLEYADAWNMWLPESLSRLSITSDGHPTAAGPGPGSEGAVLAFSGGLDSAHALIGHATGLFGLRSLPISHAVMVQGFDISLDDSQTFANAEQEARQQLDPFGVPLVTVRTNWREYCVDWEMGFALGLASVLHLFDDVCARAIFAADDTYVDLEHRWGSNPVTNHLLGDGDFPIVCSGFGSTRTDKAAAVLEHPTVSERIRVCWEGAQLDRNCGRCEKCVRTQLNFLAAGAVPPSCLGEPDPALVRNLQARNPIQFTHLEQIEANKDNLPSDIRAAFDEMIARERRRFPDPTGAAIDAAEQLQALEECRARRAELESALRAATSSRRVRLITTLLAPFDRARARLARVASGRRSRPPP